MVGLPSSRRFKHRVMQERMNTSTISPDCTAYVQGVHRPLGRGQRGWGASSWGFMTPNGLTISAKCSREPNHYSFTPGLMAIMGVLESAESNSVGVIRTSNEALITVFNIPKWSTRNSDDQRRYDEMSALRKTKGLEGWRAEKCSQDALEMKELTLAAQAEIDLTLQQAKSAA